MYNFTNFSPIPTTSGGHIFLCLKKDMEERQTKGLQSRPLESGFLYGGSEGRRADFSTCAPKCNLRDLGPSVACFALFPRTLLYCSNCGEFVGAERITNLICSRKLGGCEGISIFHGTAARRAHGSSAEHAMRDLIASTAPLRNGSHKARQNGPKHYPGDSRGRQ